MSINGNEYYNTYHGQNIKDLQIILELAKQKNLSIIYLAGDSSLDNKFWIKDTYYKTSLQYETLLDPPQSVPDIAYWINKSVPTNKYISINTAVEESTLTQRVCKGLYIQDKFIVNNMLGNDYLIISVGGNDIALKPSFWTIINMILLLMTPLKIMKQGYLPGIKHFEKLFYWDMAKYINKLTQNHTPCKILLCMIYYPDINPVPSWAGKMLYYLGYNSYPEKLQYIIQKVYDKTIFKLSKDNSHIISIPLFKILDCTNSNDYVQRVEPSIQGGEKMAKYFVKCMF